jgi:catechol 2,3-dioxygenase-like lactoylglutathione lyase family enzyme
VAILGTLRTVTYRVPDLDRGREWYQRVLGAAPVHVSPFAVVFVVGDSTLTLIRADGDGCPVAYWSVDDADAVHHKLIQAGATCGKEVATSALRTRMGTVVDPFGNVIGITSRPADGHKKSLDEQPSETAQGVA